LGFFEFITGDFLFGNESRPRVGVAGIPSIASVGVSSFGARRKGREGRADGFGFGATPRNAGAKRMGNQCLVARAELRHHPSEKPGI